LSDDALSQRSRALTLMGEIAFARGDLNGALRRYREAMATTAEAADRAPDNPQNLFDHAQNLFWVGYIDYQRRDLDKAAAAFREYRRLADQMIALAPLSDPYRLERIYADTNLGTVLMAQRRYSAAAGAYQASLEPVEQLVARAPSNLAYQDQLIELLAWLADAREYGGQLDDALAHRRRQLQLVAQRRAIDDGDTLARRQEMSARAAMARLLSAMGQASQALAQSRAASQQAAWLIRTEPDNTEWLQARTNADFERAEIELAAGNGERAREAAAQGCSTTSALLAKDRSVAAWRTRLQLQCLKIMARIDLRGGATDQALSLARQALVLARTEKDPIDRGFETAAAEMTLGDALSRDGQREVARGAYQRALAAWPKGIEEPPRDRAARAVLLRQLGRRGEAETLSAALQSIGYRQADYLGRRV
jgi:tetratricopeptide (TPR) repeat protein